MGIDPLGPENKLIAAFSHLFGVTAPNTDKVVVEAKSPLTGGNGDGNIGSKVAYQITILGIRIKEEFLKNKQ